MLEVAQDYAVIGGAVPAHTYHEPDPIEAMFDVVPMPVLAVEVPAATLILRFAELSIVEELARFQC